MRPSKDRLAWLRGMAKQGATFSNQEVREILEALDVAEAALREVREHHIQINTERGRALASSRTIRLCNNALGEK